MNVKSPVGYFLYMPSASAYQSLNDSRLPTWTGTARSGRVPSEMVLWHSASTVHTWLFNLFQHIRGVLDDWCKNIATTLTLSISCHFVLVIISVAQGKARGGDTFFLIMPKSDPTDHDARRRQSRIVETELSFLSPLSVLSVLPLTPLCFVVFSREHRLRGR